jgi:hypothetical protein
MSLFITVLKFIYVFRSFRVCLMKLGAISLVAYRLIIVTSFWCISPFICILFPSLSHLINACLKSTFSELSIAIPACSRGPLTRQIFFQSFTLSQCLFSVDEMGLLQQQIV